MNPPRSLFITGAGSGLGAAAAQRFLALGWRVGLCGRRPGPLRQLAAEAGGAAEVHALDVSDAAAVEAALEAFRPDALLNCAAILGQGSVLEELTPARFAEVLAINVSGSFNTCRAAMRQWREDGQPGDIVNVSSLGGIRGLQKFPGFAAYAASKHAIVGLTEALALDGRAHGIRVNAVAPGTLRTPMTAALGLLPATLPEAIVPTLEFLLDRARSGPLTGTTIEVHCNDD